MAMSKDEIREENWRRKNLGKHDVDCDVCGITKDAVDMNYSKKWEVYFCDKCREEWEASYERKFK